MIIFEYFQYNNCFYAFGIIYPELGITGMVRFEDDSMGLGRIRGEAPLVLSAKRMGMIYTW